MSDIDNDRMLAGVTAIALNRGRAIDAWSLALTLAALAGALWAMEGRTAWSNYSIAACVFAGLTQRYYAARVAFDAELFRDLARRLTVASAGNASVDALAAMDGAIARLGLRKQDSGQARDFDARSHGALRLLARQALCLILQFAAVLAAVVC